MNALLAQVVQRGGGVGTWSVADVAVAAVVCVGILALVVIFARVAGFEIPKWAWQILGIVVAVVLVVLAIRFVSGM